MPIFALGFAIAIVCAVHAYRTGQDRFWIFVLLIAPGVGSLLYVILVVFPQWQAQHGSRTRTLSPKEMLAKAQRDVEHAPTVDNRLRLADVLLEQEQPRAAARIYEELLSGEFAQDPRILNGLAVSEANAGNFAASLAAYERMKASGTKLSRESELAHARALAADGQVDAAIAAFHALLPHYPGEAARGHFAKLLMDHGRWDEARAILAELNDRAKHAPPHAFAKDKAIYDWARAQLEGGARG